MLGKCVSPSENHSYFIRHLFLDEFMSNSTKKQKKKKKKNTTHEKITQSKESKLYLVCSFKKIYAKIINLQVLSVDIGISWCPSIIATHLYRDNA